jgi:hypothetical protein
MCTVCSVSYHRILEWWCIVRREGQINFYANDAVSIIQINVIELVEE